MREKVNGSILQQHNHSVMTGYRFGHSLRVFVTGRERGHATTYMLLMIHSPRKYTRTLAVTSHCQLADLP